MHLKTAKGRSASSTRWLNRQLKDPYVQKAKELGLRGRAYFKLQQIDEKFHIFHPKDFVVDLGCAPGGWTLYATKKTKSTNQSPCVVGLDILPCESIPGAILLQQDFTEDIALTELNQAIGTKKINIVISDMAPNTTGMPKVDHLKIMYLIELALDFALKTLAPKGVFITKIFQGADQKEVLDILKKNFKEVKFFKPDASRKESSEMYLIAKGFQCTQKK